MKTYRISLNFQWVLHPTANTPIVWKINSEDEARAAARDLQRRFPNASIDVYEVSMRGNVEAWDRLSRN